MGCGCQTGLSPVDTPERSQLENALRSLWTWGKRQWQKGGRGGQQASRAALALLHGLPGSLQDEIKLTTFLIPFYIIPAFCLKPF